MFDIQTQIDLIMDGASFEDPDLEAKMREELAAKLRANRPLVVKSGIDPTTPDLHLGHTVCLRKLRQLQDLGHRSVWVIGDFTARVGDTTGHSARKPLPREVTQAYARNYQMQSMGPLGLSIAEVYLNSSWLRAMSFEEVVQMASSISVGRLLDMKFFSERMRARLPIHVHELLYACMQAYDSVYLVADLEIGGGDQLPNMLVTRDLQRAYGQDPQVVLPMPILRGIDGKRRMAGGNPNAITLSDPPQTVYAKVMRIPDNLMPDYGRLVLGWSVARTEELQREIAAGQLHPRDAKMRLAREITAMYCGQKCAEEAQADFVSQFQDGQAPQHMEERTMPAGIMGAPTSVLDLLTATQLVSSRSEGRRLIAQGGVRVDGIRVPSVESEVSVKNGSIIQLGKRRFVALKVT